MDIHEIANQVLNDTEDKRRTKLSSFLESTTSDIGREARSALMIRAYMADPQIQRDVEKWAEENKHDFAFKMEEVARILLQDMMKDILRK
jgi:hypothetical protein